MTLLSQIQQIEYVEKPKRLYFQLLAGKQVSCTAPVTFRPPYLSGRGVLVGIVDSGIDYRHPAFRRADGSTRIRALWDQSLVPDAKKGWQAPEGFLGGVEFTARQIDAALQASAEQGGAALLPTVDGNGHGTAVAGIAAGSVPERAEAGQSIDSGGNEKGRQEAAESGMAPESELLIVKLGTPKEGGFPKTTELMRGVAYLVKKALTLEMPLAVNISFGNTYGSHDGTSLLERFLDNAAEVGRSVICIGSGNEGAAMGHASGIALTESRVELSVGAYESAFNLQLWKNYEDVFQIRLLSPAGEELSFSTENANGEGMRRAVLEENEVLLLVGTPTPYSVRQEIYIELLPTERYVTQGIWSLILTPVSVVNGGYSLYLPAQASLSADTRFYRPTPEATLTIPSTAARAITVGAYDTVYDAYADFSGRGYSGLMGQQGAFGNKPDLVAPGVGILAPAVGGGDRAVTGTSFSAPFVTGAAALLMEWGIVQKRDPYLYGQKVKAYLQKGARKLPGFTQFPNPMVGYGALCVAESLPE